MISDIKTMLGASSNYSDKQIELALDMVTAEIKDYCNTDTLTENAMGLAIQMVMIKLQKFGDELLVSQSFSGVSQTYLADYPPYILRQLDANKVKKVVIL